MLDMMYGSETTEEIPTQELTATLSQKIKTSGCSGKNKIHSKYRTTSFRATSYYLAHGIFVVRTKREVVLYERSYYFLI